MRNFLLSISTLLCAAAGLHAEVVIRDSAAIHFHTSHINLDTGFMDNRRHLDRLSERLIDMGDSTALYRIRNIRVVGGASPEGSVAFNEKLSRGRADRIFSFFSAIAPLNDSITEFTFLGRDWHGLRKLVEQDKNVPDGQQALEIIDKIIRTPGDNHLIQQLRQLDKGATYSYMYKHLFPSLRASGLYVEYLLVRPAIKPITYRPALDTSVPTPVLSPIPALYMPEFIECRPFYMALKSNLLYDALALPNIGAEFYIGKNFSITGNWTYGWWDTDRRHRYWRAYGGDAGIRWWFGSEAHRKPLTGHHIGLYAGAFTFDFEFGGTGYMGGKPHGTLWDKCILNTGIEYGYSLPIARRLNLDFTIGLGYAQGTYYKYKPKNGQYVWESTHRLRWFGPTKAEVSLVWLIGCGNYNAGKGGRQ